jgi:hypothetical protein
MAIVIDGSANTIAGLAVGGLPDGSVDTDTLAANAVATAKIADDAVTAAKSTISPGITGYDTWSLTANKNWSGTNFLDADFARNTSFPALGSAMSKASEVFSFPTTGIWEIFFQFAAFDSVTNSYTQVWIDKSNDGGSSNWSTITNCFDMIADDGSADTYGGSACSALVDVDNVSNIKVRFGTANEQGAQFRGHASTLITGVIFKRIGDT